jgi:proteasome lid subunit RPN8/RPN11
MEKKIDVALTEAFLSRKDFDLAKNVCAIAYRHLTDFERLLDRTEETGREHAMCFCVDDRGEVITSETRGTEAWVEPPKCPEGTVKMGDFHTHPDGIEHFSATDIAGALYRGDKFFCVGAVVGGKPLSESSITCYSVDPSDPMYPVVSKKIVDFGAKIYELEEKVLKDYVMKGEEPPKELEEELHNLYDKFNELFNEAVDLGVIRVVCSGMQFVDGEKLYRKRVEEWLKEEIVKRLREAD